MNKITFKLNKVRLAIRAIGALTLMTTGYFAISAGITTTNRVLDTFAVSRVQAKNLVPTTVKNVPVLSTADVKSQVSQAIAENLGK